MKKVFSFFVCATLSCAVASAQYAGEFDLGNKNSDYKGYNRFGVSYNNGTYSPNKDMKDYWFEENFSLNGFGIDYIHGFSISNYLPMFIETGVNANIGFGIMDSYEYDNGSYGWTSETQMQNLNLQVPLNYVYRFGVADNLSIAPYLGLNFKLNLMSRFREVEEEDGDREEYDWISMFDKDEMGDDGTWNRFQMGWHIGVGLQYDKIHLGIQYGTDFIPAYHYKDKEYGDNYTANTSNLKISLSYTF